MTKYRIRVSKSKGLTISARTLTPQGPKMFSAGTIIADRSKESVAEALTSAFVEIDRRRKATQSGASKAKKGEGL